MAGEIFIVSVVFWGALLVVYVLLNRRLALLTGKVEEIERMQEKE